MSMDLQIEGVGDMLKMLEKFSSREAKIIKKETLRRAGNVVRDGMRAEVDRIPNDKLSPSGKHRVKLATKPVFRRGKINEIHIGAVYKGQKHIAPDAHWYELGTMERFTESGAGRGFMEPTPFMRPGYEATKEEALKEMTLAFSEEIEKMAHGK